jgi:hypothetical protein
MIIIVFELFRLVFTVHGWGVETSPDICCQFKPAICCKRIQGWLLYQEFSMQRTNGLNLLRFRK